MTSDLVSKLNNTLICSYNYLMTVSFIFQFIGTLMIAISVYTIYEYPFGFPYNACIMFLVTGIILSVGSLLTWISLCHYTNAYAKCMLVIFSIVMIGLCILNLLIAVYSGYYYDKYLDNYSNNTVITDSIFNDTINTAYQICCDGNTTLFINDICSEFIINDNINLHDECISYTTFKYSFMVFLRYIFKWITGVSSIVIILCSIAFIGSCCLIGTHKRVLHYQNKKITTCTLNHTGPRYIEYSDNSDITREVSYNSPGYYVYNPDDEQDNLV